MCMCVSRLGKSSAEQTPKTELPKALLSAPLLPMLGDLRAPSDFPLSPGASVIPMAFQGGLGAPQKLAAFATHTLGRGS